EQRPAHVTDTCNEIRELDAGAFGKACSIREADDVRALRICLNANAQGCDELAEEPDVVRKVVSEMLPVARADAWVEESIGVSDRKTMLFGRCAQPRGPLEVRTVVTGAVQSDH